jgi:flagellar basal-body rod protein FlgB
LAGSGSPQDVSEGSRVSQVYLFELASHRTQWLSSRQQLIAGNVANANTPQYAAQDLKPFSAVLDQQFTMTTTNPAHITPPDIELAAERQTDSDSADPTISGNSVNLQDEMMKLGEVGRDSSMANSVKKIFHQMMMSALK